MSETAFTQPICERLEECARAVEGAYYSSTRTAADIREASAIIKALVSALQSMPDEIDVFRLMQSTGGPRGEMAKAVGRRIEEIRGPALTKATGQ